MMQNSSRITGFRYSIHKALSSNSAKPACHEEFLQKSLALIQTYSRPAIESSFSHQTIQTASTIFFLVIFDLPTLRSTKMIGTS